MLPTKKVSQQDIVVDRPTQQVVSVKGGDWFPEVYANIFLLAKKKSGKTTAVANILRHTAGRRTKFVFVVSTINKDEIWLKIVKYWKRKGHAVATYDEIGERRDNVIRQWLAERKMEAEEEQAEKEAKENGEYKPPVDQAPRVHMMGGSGKTNVEEYRQQRAQEREQKREEQGVVKKKHKLYPEWIVVCDDLGDAMRHPDITQLLKTNRHYKAKVILSSQFIHDLMPAALTQLDYVLAFGRIPEVKVRSLAKILNLDITEDQLWMLYSDATSKKHQFLYIDTRFEVYRRGFTQQYQLSFTQG